MTNATKVSFLDLITPHAELKQELLGVFETAIDAAGFIGGPMVQGFEEDFARFCDVRHCVGVGSGTDALRFALIAAGVKSGDTVVTVPNTFIATTEAISQAGAQIAFVDIDEVTYNLDSQKLREYLEKHCDVDSSGVPVDKRTKARVRAVIPVHLYGQMADMDAILELAEKYNLIVIEDACQAHGAEYFSRKQNRWRKAGSMGLAAAFSFYPGKNLGACGEAGAVTTNDAALAQKVRMLRDHGQAQKYYHEMEGYNGRLDSIQAGILQVKLQRLAQWNEERRACAERYANLLAPLADEVVLPVEQSWSRPVYHLYVIQHRDRDGLQSYLANKGISTGIHYPIPLHLQNAYKNLYAGSLPVTEKVAQRILSLPMYPQLLPAQQEQVAQAIAEFCQSRPANVATVSRGA